SNTSSGGSSRRRANRRQSISLLAGRPISVTIHRSDDRPIDRMTDTRKEDLGSRASAATDIPRGSWIDRLLPAAARPYGRLMRFDRPIGTWLLLFPCWWSFFLALDSAHLGSAWQGPIEVWAILGPVLLFAIGAIVMRGAGCTYNDIVDRDFDAKVAR